MSNIKRLRPTGTTNTNTCGKLKPERSNCNYEYPVELFVCEDCNAHAWVITTKNCCPRHQQPEPKYFDPGFPDNDDE
jgi:hypothetical protein